VSRILQLFLSVVLLEAYETGYTLYRVPQAFDRYSVLGATIAPLLRKAVAARAAVGQPGGESGGSAADGDSLLARVSDDDTPPGWLVGGLAVLRAAAAEAGEAAAGGGDESASEAPVEGGQSSTGTRQRAQALRLVQSTLHALEERVGFKQWAGSKAGDAEATAAIQAEQAAVEAVLKEAHKDATTQAEELLRAACALPPDAFYAPTTDPTDGEPRAQTSVRRVVAEEAAARGLSHHLAATLAPPQCASAGNGLSACVQRRGPRLHGARACTKGGLRHGAVYALIGLSGLSGVLGT